MLRAYNVDELRTGMKVGRNVQDIDGTVLIRSGTVIKPKDLDKLDGKMVFSVYIDVPEEEIHADIVGNEHLIDGEYMQCYKMAYSRVQEIYFKLGREGELDIPSMEEIIVDDVINLLCEGSTAVSQIHNMTRWGDYVIHHALNLFILAGLMANWMRLRWAKKTELMTAAMLCDVGKMKVPRDILDKTGKLTPEELDKVKRHVDYSYDMLKYSVLSAHQDLLMGILHHHERCDGSGYLNRLKSDQISDYGKIIAILDIYDAMAATRAYAKRRSPFDVLKILYEDMIAGKLDTNHTVLFIKNLNHSLNGNWVGLSNGERAKIVYVDETRISALPIVQTLKNEFIDLNRRTDIKIETILTANEVS